MQTSEKVLNNRVDHEWKIKGTFHTELGNLKGCHRCHEGQQYNQPCKHLGVAGVREKSFIFKHRI